MSNNIFYDFEFAEDGETIIPISVGMVKEHGEPLYIQFLDFVPSDCNDWVQENVLPHLLHCPSFESLFSIANLIDEIFFHRENECKHADCPWMWKNEAATLIRDFVEDPLDTPPTFYGWYSAYDHVALCQLYGTMADLPEGWPMLTFDLKQWHLMLGEPTLSKQESTVHNALEDAKQNLQRYKELYAFHKEETRKIVRRTLQTHSHMEW